MLYQPDITILLISWNNEDFLLYCLNCLYEQTYTNFKIIIVDNGSDNDLIYNIEQSNPKLQVKQLHKNIGFAAANNIGAGLAQGKWLILLNIDAFPEPHWLENLVA